MKNRILEINFVKAVAIFAVLVIHATATPSVKVPWGSLSALFYVLANQLSMFAVPLFLLVNGLVLFYRYHGDWSGAQALAFYKKRLQYILVPYLLWSLFYYAFNQWLMDRRIEFDPAFFWRLLLWGHSSYHLYFMVIVIQVYAVFPLLMSLVRRFRLQSRHVAWIGLLGQAAFYSVNKWDHPIPHIAALMPNYLLVFSVGAAIGMDYRAFAERSRHLWWTFGAAVGTGLLYVLMLAASKSGAVYWSPLYAALYNLYAVLVGVSALWIGRKAVALGSRLSQAVLAFGAASFGIYLVHPAVQSIWRHLYNPGPGGAVYHAYNALTLLLDAFVSWGIVLLLKKIKFSWVWFGKS
ncbi:acyltransferase [Cohnella caldifontis]|uniref:acyltransferase n=1 Tax=Cohnella caldifontis TaxID=3027471 RepID=UPI0023EB4386|nr:acyltransferase [Cohnella sp. YIM B05605]